MFFVYLFVCFHGKFLRDLIFADRCKPTKIRFFQHGITPALDAHVCVLDDRFHEPKNPVKHTHNQIVHDNISLTNGLTVYTGEQFFLTNFFSLCAGGDFWNLEQQLGEEKKNKKLDKKKVKKWFVFR